MTGRPARRASAVAWDLRAAWAGRWDVGLSLRRGPRLRGYVERVAATDSYALLWVGDGLTHVPLGRVLAVRRPHFHEPDWPARPPAPPPRAALAMPGQLALFGALEHERATPSLASRRAEGKRRSVGR